MEKSLLLEVLGDYPLIRVLDFLIENRIYDYTKKDISENSSVSWSTLYSVWPVLERNKIVKKTRTIGRATLYKLNSDSQIVKALIELDKSLTLAFAEQIGEKVLVK